VLCCSALAQETKSTWQRIMDTKTLRVGLANGEPLAFKDTTNSTAPGAVKFGDVTWRGVGPVLADLIAKALGVKLVIVESSHASSIAGLQADLIDMFPATWAELNDPKYKIGVVLGAHTDFFATEHLPKASVQRYPDINTQVSALQSGRVDGVVMVGTVAAAAYGRLKTGKLITPTPVDVTTNSVAIRQEMDQRWHNYLTTAINYYYHSGKTAQIFNEFLAFRGIDPKEVLPVQRELWPPPR
jgi:polar amino acid transport system substrate-binding protein